MAGSERDDRAWVRGAQRGSVADLESLFRHHRPRAYRAACLVVHGSAAAELTNVDRANSSAPEPDPARATDARVDARLATGRRRLVLSVALCYGQCVPGKRRSTLMTIALHLLSKSSRLFV